MAFSNTADNHVGGLTFWNLHRLGSPIAAADFWRVTDDPALVYGSPFIVKPNFIGIHGAETTFKRSTVGILESVGAPVTPHSLYEAQLALRLGHRPDWIDFSIRQWPGIKRQQDAFLSRPGGK